MHKARKPELRRTSLVAPADDLDALREIAEANHRTLSSEVRHLIARRIAEHRELVVKPEKTGAAS